MIINSKHGFNINPVDFGSTPYSEDCKYEVFNVQENGEETSKKEFTKFTSAFEYFNELNEDKALCDTGSDPNKRITLFAYIKS